MTNTTQGGAGQLRSLHASDVEMSDTAVPSAATMTPGVLSEISMSTSMRFGLLMVSGGALHMRRELSYLVRCAGVRTNFSE